MAVVQKRKIRWVISLFLVMLYFSCLTAEAQYGGGTGAAHDPYLIYTAEQMNAIGANANDWDKHFKLMADIDLGTYTGNQFNIIGGNTPFTGVFDGDGHTISNFTYTYTNTNRIGLFGSVQREIGYVQGENALIKDLGLIDPNVDAGTSALWYRGQHIGSLVGWLYEGNITNCYVEGGSVSGGRWVGGLVGVNWGIITNCYATGSVSGGRYVGGLVGASYGTITNCYATGDVTGDSRVGGLVGNNDGTITNCYSTSSVSGDYCVGGLVGTLNYGTITNCYSTASVSGRGSVGGLVGGNGVASRTGDAGGTITNCYSASDVSGDSRVGGLVGYNLGTISNCYDTGSVTGTTDVGGLVGWNWGEVSNSFWDTETSGQSISAGGTGLSTAEMQTAAIFLEAGWDFVDETANGREDIWWILEGQDYPGLLWEFLAFSPHPPNGAVDVIQPLILSWFAGGSDLHHDIYFGEDEQVVVDATTENPVIYRGRQPGEMTTYDPGTLELDKTYYWRIDEVNEADLNSPWKGYVWSFTTANFFIVVDGFEDYNDWPGHRIYETWSDGWEIPTNGATLGYPEPLPQGEHILETTNVHGGGQSLPFFYDNSAAASSEATVNVAELPIGSDWTKYGVKSLSLWFYGDPSNSVEQMYVKLNGVKVLYDGDASNISKSSWHQWNINLAEFTGVDLSNVTELCIGFERGAGGSGMVLFDDIRLYRPAPAQ